MKVTLNQTQKLGLIISLMLLLALIGLHNPFSGYESETIFMGTTTSEIRTIEWDFLSWRSRGAWSHLISTTQQLLGYTTLIAIYALAWVWIFKDHKS
jgi:hypothetical protein